MGQEFYIQGYGNPPTYFLQSALEECQEACGYTGIFEENKKLLDLLGNKRLLWLYRQRLTRAVERLNCKV